MSFGEDRSGEQSAFHFGIQQLGLREIRVDEGGIAQVRELEIRAAQMGAGHAGVDEIRRLQIRAFQVDIIQSRIGQHHAVEAGPETALAALQPSAVSFQHMVQRG